MRLNPSEFAQANAQASSTGRTALDPATFERIVALAEAEAGLAIPPTKMSMVESRMTRRLRATGAPDFGSYLDLVSGPAGKDELQNMISALTTNVSHFFREDHHFATFKTKAMPELLTGTSAKKRIRIWSAGCSTGQEPYTIAMTLLQIDPSIAQKDVRILATDIDRPVLEIARAGSYDDRQMESVPPEFGKHFLKASDGQKTISDGIKKMVTFRHLNLMQAWPMTSQFDVIFCRNVLIYFSEATQRTLWPRFANTLHPGGWLFLGHSERIQDSDRSGFDTAGITTYRRAMRTQTALEK